MSITIDLQPLTNSVSDSELAALSAKNPDLRLETDTAGKLIIMPPTPKSYRRKKRRFNLPSSSLESSLQVGKGL